MCNCLKRLSPASSVKPKLSEPLQHKGDASSVPPCATWAFLLPRITLTLNSMVRCRSDITLDAERFAHPSGLPETITMMLLIDNYDSFTWNLYQYFCQLGANVRVVRNDAITLDEMCALPLSHLVISPGPCTPDQSGISLQAIRHFAGRLPVLGVCLGHQAIAQVFGAQIVRARNVMHGKTSAIQHNGGGVFRGLNQPLTVTRYHSLIVKADTLPDEFDVTAWSLRDGQPDEIMGIRHKTLALEGVQFHPESILSEQGHLLLANFLNQ